MLRLNCKVNFTKPGQFLKQLFFSFRCQINFTSVKGDEQQKLKNNLEALRKSRGISQEELANAMEVSRQTIISLEKGKYNPSIILAFKLSHYFGLKIEDIFIFEPRNDK